MNKRFSDLTLAVVLVTATSMLAIPALAQMGQSVLSPVRCGTKLIQVGKDNKIQFWLNAANQPPEIQGGAAGAKSGPTTEVPVSLWGY